MHIFVRSLLILTFGLIQLKKNPLVLIRQSKTVCEPDLQIFYNFYKPRLSFVFPFPGTGYSKALINVERIHCVLLYLLLLYTFLKLITSDVSHLS